MIAREKLFRQFKKAEFFLYNEQKNKNRVSRIKALKKISRLSLRWRNDWIRLNRIITRCELDGTDGQQGRYIQMIYLGSGVIAITDDIINLEVRISQAAWELRRAQSVSDIWIALDFQGFKGIW